MSPQEQSLPNHIPSFTEANGAYNEILAHNKRHTGMGAGLGNLFRAMLEDAEPIDIEDPTSGRPAEDIYVAINERTKQDVTEGDMHAELQEVLHEDTFLRIGLKMAPFGSHMINLEGERTTSTALVPILENTELFKEFLGTINPEEVEIGEDQRLLASVLGNLRSTIMTCFDPIEREKVPEEFQQAVIQHGENAMRSFLTVAPEYERLGLDAESLRKKFAVKPEGAGYVCLGKNATQEQRDEKAAHEKYDSAHGLASTYEDLEGYVTYWGKDLLPEFIVADRGQYLKAPEDQGFGPAEWHTDGGQRYWGPALGFVAELAQDDRTKDFAEEVRKGLVASLDTAIGKIDRGNEDNYVVNNRADLVNIKNVLTGQDFDAEQLAEYTRKRTPEDYGL